MKNFIKKQIVLQKIRVADFWNENSGDWYWLQEKTMPVASLNRHLWRLSVPSFSFHFLLGISGIIATLGLLANSVAVIIGAMIIAPLMGPIIGIAYAMVMANRRLLRCSFLTITTGVTLTIFISYLSALVVGLTEVSSEILARANPTLIDLGLALAAGAVGAFANSRRRIAAAIPGVAIAVALVPPLSVVGIGLALGKETLSAGSFLLFLTNFTGIIFSGGIIFLWQSYGNLERAKRGLIISVFILALLALPLSFSLENILVKQEVRQTVSKLISRQSLTFSQSDIRYIKVNNYDDNLLIEIEVAAPLGSISRYQIELVKKFLEKELKEKIIFKVKIIPMEVFESKVMTKKLFS